MQFKAPKPSRYRTERIRYPAVLMPRFAGVRVQAFVNVPDYSVTIIPEFYQPVDIRSDIATKLAECAEMIVKDSPNFETSQWKGGLVFEGTLVSGDVDDLEWCLGEEQAPPDDTVMYCDLVIPQSVWAKGVDTYDVWMRRATLTRGFYYIGCLKSGESPCVAMSPFQSFNNEADAMCTLQSWIDDKTTAPTNGNIWNNTPFNTVTSGLFLNMEKVWNCKSPWGQCPSSEQIDDLSL